MPQNLYIIDGHALIYAAHFAPFSGSLNAPDGEPTKATLIFTNTVLKLLNSKAPDKLVVAMDARGKTFRHEMYEAYKANRPEMPEELPVQIARIDEILAAMNIPVYRVEGYEADDLIGTLAKQGEANGFKVYICSKDKDLEQLMSDNVSMYDIKNDEVMDVEGLMTKKGIRPDQVIDVLTLQGDTSDNIPGVPDVGPKTALQWVQKYGGLDAIIAHKDDIKGKRGNSLRESIEQIALSRKLVTISRDVPMPVDFEAMTVTGADKEKLVELYGKLGFNKQLEKLGAEPVGQVPGNSVSVPKVEKAHYVLVETAEDFEAFFAQLQQQNRFAIDTETTGLNPVKADMVGLSFSWKAGDGYYLPVRAPLGLPCLDWEAIREPLREVLEDKEVKKIGQNIKYDLIVLRKAGIKMRGVAFDTMLASYVLFPDRTRHNMDSLALDHLGHETMKIEALIGKGKNQLTFDMVDTQTATDYAAEDADITWRLGEYFDKYMSDKELRELFEAVEMPLVAVLAEMEYNGVALDVPWLKKLSSKITRRMEELTEAIYTASESTFNVDSPKQLSEVLFVKLQLPAGKKTKTGYSTDQEVLEGLIAHHPVVSLVLEYRQLSKLKGTYIDKLPLMICSETQRVHCSFNQSVTATGRLSSSDPNLQNIPIRTELGKSVRKAFVAQDTANTIVAADYSQIELRLLAHFSQDEQLMGAFQAGEDIHRAVAAQVYGIAVDSVEPAQRSKAKAVNFGIIYGQSAYGLSRSIGISVEEASQFINDYFKRYPTIKAYMDSVVSDAKMN
ncbi:MAG: DNA polymerase I, partial [Phycisphaerae bacterium]|nr:DNA polymerase I [Phycisphaerae bacterium]